MDDAFTAANGVDNVRAVDLGIRAMYPGSGVTKTHTWVGGYTGETVVIIQIGKAASICIWSGRRSGGIEFRWSR